MPLNGVVGVVVPNNHQCGWPGRVWGQNGDPDSPAWVRKLLIEMIPCRRLNTRVSEGCPKVDCSANWASRRFRTEQAFAWSVLPSAYHLDPEHVAGILKNKRGTSSFGGRCPKPVCAVEWNARRHSVSSDLYLSGYAQPGEMDVEIRTSIRRKRNFADSIVADTNKTGRECGWRWRRHCHCCLIGDPVGIADLKGEVAAGEL